MAGTFPFPSPLTPGSTPFPLFYRCVHHAPYLHFKSSGYELWNTIRCQPSHRSLRRATEWFSRFRTYAETGCRDRRHSLTIYRRTRTHSTSNLQFSSTHHTVLVLAYIPVIPSSSYPRGMYPLRPRIGIYFSTLQRICRCVRCFHFPPPAWGGKLVLLLAFSCFFLLSLFLAKVWYIFTG